MLTFALQVLYLVLVVVFFSLSTPIIHPVN